MSDFFTEGRMAPIQAKLVYYIDGELVTVQQNFPTTADELISNLNSENVFGGQITDVLDSVCETPINALKYNLPRKPNLDELNELAHLLEGMDATERMCVGAVLEAGQCKDSLATMINLAHNLDLFDFYPGAFTTQEFGGIMLETHASQQWEARERLRASDDLNDRSFAEYVERIEQCIDLAKYAPLAQAYDGGILTQSGYVIPLAEELPQIYTGPQDILAEHRLTEHLEERKPSLLGAVAVARENQKQLASVDAPGTERPAVPEPEL
ncbi:hypothetical protein LJC60_06805 [Ruminococcaceae bacterium OttesenSCG-928-D13]|nr:hypothetical protein [Ruminococcaceae bacterium OttesenSCG-928-D13]